jgi:hypothetical protein
MRVCALSYPREVQILRRLQNHVMKVTFSAFGDSVIVIVGHRKTSLVPYSLIAQVMPAANHEGQPTPTVSIP